jgi:thiol-disulfide isomerase/thioredoxin
MTLRELTVSHLPRVIAHGVAALTVLGVLSFVGCGDGPAPPAENAADGIALATIDSRGLNDAVARHRGQVVLVEFWATWCVPCVKLFPHTVELQRRLADRGLVVVSVSMDGPENRDAALRFLRDHRATFENFISRYGVGSEAFDAFNIGDGALPHLKLYDREGRLRKSLVSGGQSLDHEEIETAIDELLNR